MTVSPGYLEGNGIKVHDERLDEVSSQGKTVVFVRLSKATYRKM